MILLGVGISIAVVVLVGFLVSKRIAGDSANFLVAGRSLPLILVGGALMGTGGVLSMGCTVGQAITGVSTLALGSILVFFSIVIGAAATMKYQYWRMTQEV